MAPAVRSFLAQHDFAGKTVVPFMINGGSRMETKQSEVDRWIDVVKALAELFLAAIFLLKCKLRLTKDC